jgi:hypothetical protein
MIFVGDWAPQGDRIAIDLDDDYLFLNLEGPLASRPITNEELLSFQESKCGPLLWNKSLPIFNGKIHYSLANNHFSDLGEYFAKSTISEILTSGANYSGYGDTESDSRQPFYFDYQGQRVGFLSITEKQFGEATFDSPGTAVLGPWVYQSILDMKLSCDFVVISIHAGAEDFPWPLPFWQEIYRSYISTGANMVIGHHPHIPQGFEYFEGGFIAYSLGNFAVKSQVWGGTFGGLWSLGIRLNFSSGSPVISVIHLEQVRQSIGQFSHVIHESKSSYFTDFIKEQNKLLSQPKIVEHLWQHLARDLWVDYLRNFYVNMFQERTIIAMIKQFVGRNLRLESSLSATRSHHANKLLAYHALSCETHRQIAIIAMSAESCVTSNYCTESTQLLFQYRVRLKSFGKSF